MLFWTVLFPNCVVSARGRSIVLNQPEEISFPPVGPILIANWRPRSAGSE